MGGKNLHCSNHMSNSMLMSIFAGQVTIFLWFPMFFPMVYPYFQSLFLMNAPDSQDVIPSVV